jgi:hypothetical protein
MDEGHKKALFGEARAVVISVIIVPSILAWLQVRPPIIIGIGLSLLVILSAWENGYLTPAHWSPEGTVQNGRLRAIAGVALLCLVVGGGYLASSHWKQAEVQQPPVTEPTPAPQGPLASRFNRQIFVCDMPKRANEIGEWEQYASVVGESQGMTIEFHGLGSDGLRIEATPTPSTTPYVKMATEIRRLKDQLYVTRMPDFTGTIYDALSKLPITDPNTPEIIENTRRVEKLIGALVGTCHLI